MTQGSEGSHWSLCSDGPTSRSIFFAVAIDIVGSWAYQLQPLRLAKIMETHGDTFTYLDYSWTIFMSYRTARSRCAAFHCDKWCTQVNVHLFWPGLLQAEGKNGNTKTYIIYIKSGRGIHAESIWSMMLQGEWSTVSTVWPDFWKRTFAVNFILFNVWLHVFSLFW